MSNYTIKRISQPCKLGEAPFWDHQKNRLYFVDINGQTIFSYHQDSGEIYNAKIKNGPVSVIIPVENSPDNFVLGNGHDFILVNWDGNSNVSDLSSKKLLTLESDRNDTRLNDAKVDSSGRIWIGSMGLETGENHQRDPDRGSLYSIDSNLQPKVQLSPVTLSNGIEWNLQNNVMYYIDSPTCQVVAFDFDVENATIKNKRVAFDFKKNNLESSPDGLTIDNNGNLWIASFLGSQVHNVNPNEGKLLRSIDMPVKNVTSVAFGGPNLDILYVTTATIALSQDEKNAQPDAGCLFAVEGLGVKGRRPNRFKMQN